MQRWFQQELKVCQEENVTHMEEKTISFVCRYMHSSMHYKYIDTGLFWLAQANVHYDVMIMQMFLLKDKQ